MRFHRLGCIQSIEEVWTIFELLAQISLIVLIHLLEKNKHDDSVEALDNIPPYPRSDSPERIVIISILKVIEESIQVDELEDYKESAVEEVHHK